MIKKQNVGLSFPVNQTANMAFRLGTYLHFISKATNQHGVHSPFVYDLAINCIYNHQRYEGYKSIKSYQQKIAPLFHETSRKTPQFSAKKSKLLHRLACHFSPKIIIDHSYSTGQVAAALSSYKSVKTLYSSISSEKHTEDLKSLLRSTQQANIAFSPSAMDHFFSTTDTSFDLAFLSSTDQAENSYKQYLKLLPSATEESILIIDNIYQSQATEKAWNAIKQHEQTRVTVDLFYVGVVFFRTAQVKQHFRLRI